LSKCRFLCPNACLGFAVRNRRRAQLDEERVQSGAGGPAASGAAEISCEFARRRGRWKLEIVTEPRVEQSLGQLAGERLQPKGASESFNGGRPPRRVRGSSGKGDCRRGRAGS
jgi:hypothetical protein